MTSAAAVPPLKHEKIAQVLEGEIRRGSMPKGRRLPGETALAERFAVSRNTVRAALFELGAAGLIATRSGKGSFVTFDGNPLDVELGWARALHEQGVVTRIEVVLLDEITDPLLAAELGETQDRFVLIDRLRSADGEGVIAYERSRIPASPPVQGAVADGQATVTRDDSAAADVSVEAPTLGSLYLGGVDAVTLAAAAQLVEHTPNAALRVRALLSPVASVYGSTHF